jgi:membrane protease subunit HflK
VLSETSKVMVDVPEGNSLFYLPLDKLIQQSGRDSGSRANLPLVDQTPAMPVEESDEARFRDTRRGREIR